jgi:hypothetical protein
VSVPHPGQQLRPDADVCVRAVSHRAGITFTFLPSSIALVQSCAASFVGFSGSLVGFLPQLGAIIGATIQIAIAQSTGPLADWSSTQNSLW